MFQMFAQFFSMLTRLFSAGEHACASLDNLAHAGELMSGSVLDNAQHERNLKSIELERRIAEAKLIKPQLTVAQ